VCVCVCVCVCVFKQGPLVFKGHWSLITSTSSSFPVLHILPPKPILLSLISSYSLHIVRLRHVIINCQSLGRQPMIITGAERKVVKGNLKGVRDIKR